MSRFDLGCDTELHEVRRFEVINGEIVLESMQPGVVVSEVVRWHDLTPQTLLAWLHDAKQGRLVLPEEAMSFVPVVAAADDVGLSAQPSAPATR